MKNETKIGIMTFATTDNDEGLFFWGKPFNQPFCQWIQIAGICDFDARKVKDKKAKIRRYVKKGMVGGVYHDHIMEGIKKISK